jgi:integrase/recombinase XerD
MLKKIWLMKLFLMVICLVAMVIIFSCEKSKQTSFVERNKLTPSLIYRGLASIDISTEEGLRDYALVNLLVRTDLRLEDAARAQIGDLRQETGEAILFISGGGPGRKDDFVLLAEDTLKPLGAYVSKRGQLSAGAPLFVTTDGGPLSIKNIRRIVKERLWVIGVDFVRE